MDVEVQKIIVSAEEYDWLIDFLEQPDQPCPKLQEAFSRKPVFVRDNEA